MPDPQTSVETPTADAVEQEQGFAVGPADPDTELEASEADVAEQAAEVDVADVADAPPVDRPWSPPIEADAADAADQETIVELDDDGYR